MKHTPTSAQKIPVEFYWRHGGKQVVLTGTFDGWKQTIQLQKMAKTLDEFQATVLLDPREKTLFKFVVDGVWRCSGEFPTESDASGNVNNWRVPANEAQYQNQSFASDPVANTTAAAAVPAVTASKVQISATQKDAPKASVPAMSAVGGKDAKVRR